MTDRFTPPTKAARRDRDDALKALAESRARYADMEARVVELEAVIQKAIAECTDRDSAGDMLEVLETAPSVALAHHDREVAAQAWDEGNAAGYRDRSKWTQTSNPYRGQS